MGCITGILNSDNNIIATNIMGLKIDCVIIQKIFNFLFNRT